jgi:pre-rRNA-processing protein RIX1
MKKLCILTLTTIYLLSHQYQTLIREITTPTLPTFVSSCLGLVLSKSSGRVLDNSLSFMEPILDAFSILILRHPTIFRPFASQIRLITRPYLAPTICDECFVPSSLSKSARRTTALIHQIAGKSSSGDEWGNSVRQLVKEIHGTTDKVYRSVIEDWESICGYTSQPVDMNRELHGGGSSDDNLPEWNGIDAGLGRLVGLLRQLEEFFRHQTASFVIIPLGPILDLLARLMSVTPPKNSAMDSGYEEARLRPTIERDERDKLWAGLPSVYIATMQVYAVLADRLESQFVSVAQSCLDQVIWTFPSGQQDDIFRAILYRLVAKLLRFCGLDLPKKVVDNITPIIRACCKEFPHLEGDASTPALSMEGARQGSNGVPPKADSFLQLGTNAYVNPTPINDVLKSATKLLPLFLSHLPQQHLEAYLRAEIDRTAIICHQKEAMIASVLSPYIRKDGRSLPSILPHLCRQFPSDVAVEALLRPRFPVVLLAPSALHGYKRLQEERPEVEDDVMEDFIPFNRDEEIAKIEKTENWPIIRENISPNYTGALRESIKETMSEGLKQVSAVQQYIEEDSPIGCHNLPLPQPVVPAEIGIIQSTSVLAGEEVDSDGSDDSIHLTMAMSDSEDESIT